jgi:hypothetical protein
VKSPETIFDDFCAQRRISIVAASETHRIKRAVVRISIRRERHGDEHIYIESYEYRLVLRKHARFDKKRTQHTPPLVPTLHLFNAFIAKRADGALRASAI